MKTKARLKELFRRICILCVVVTGVMTIVATSDDDDTKSTTSANSSTIITTTNTAPVAAIISPSASGAFSEGALITFAGSGTDTEDGALTGAALFWSSSIDGRLGIGSTLADVSLSNGTHTITLTATDSDGTAHAATISITLNPEGNTLPSVSITSPADGATFSPADFITFTGTGTDAEDGTLTDTSLTWTSNKNKHIGVGPSFATDQLLSGTHLITLTGTDNANTKTTASISISIKNSLPTATITWPADGAELPLGTTIICNGTGYDAEDGELGESAMVWRINGERAGEGNTCAIDYLTTAGDYTIALHVTDQAGETDVDTIEITLE